MKGIGFYQFLGSLLEIKLYITINHSSMIKNNCPKKSGFRGHNSQTLNFVVEDLQSTIQPHHTLYHTITCLCDICLQKNNQQKQKKDGNLFKTNTVQSSSWLKKILDGLCLSGAKTLKLYLPDILFAEGQNLEIYQTCRKDGRIIKLSNSVSMKAMYPTTVRMRKQYKNQLQQNFYEKMQDSFDPQQMHAKYFNRYVPPYFHDGMKNLSALQQNKYQFKKYVLHKSKKFQMHKLQQHKMNDKQPFCIVKYKDGNCQLFNQMEFNVYSLSLLSKLKEELVFVQSYIKYKLQIEAIFYSEYTFKSGKIDSQMDEKAEHEIIVLIGGRNKFDKNKNDIQTFEQLQHDMMISNPKEYVQFMTYKIIHYLNMTSRVYIEHIKLKWIVNDIGNIYLSEVMEFSAGDVPMKFIKYRLPPKDQVCEVLHYSQDFIEHYKEMRRRKLINTQKIKKNLEDKSYDQVIKIMFPDNQPTIEQQKYNMEYIPIVRKGRYREKSHKKITKPQQQQINSNRDSSKGEQREKADFRRSVKKQSFESYLADNPHIQSRHSKRSKSINLDKWRNTHLYTKKQHVKQKINSYFTINEYNLRVKSTKHFQNNPQTHSRLIFNDQEQRTQTPQEQKTLLSMYGTTISFNNQNNKLQKCNDRNNKMNKASRYNRTQKSLSIV